MGDHDRGERKEKFCTVPARPKCGSASNCEDYIKICQGGVDYTDRCHERNNICESCKKPTRECWMILPLNMGN